MKTLKLQPNATWLIFLSNFYKIGHLRFYICSFIPVVFALMSPVLATAISFPSRQSLAEVRVALIDNEPDNG